MEKTQHQKSALLVLPTVMGKQSALRCKLCTDATLRKLSKSIKMVKSNVAVARGSYTYNAMPDEIAGGSAQLLLHKISNLLTAPR